MSRTKKNRKIIQIGNGKKEYINNNFKFTVIGLYNDEIFNSNSEKNNNENNNEIIKFESKFDIIKIIVGNEDSKYVIIYIYNDKPNIANIDKFDYNEKCNITKNMKRKIDTKILMDTIIEFIHITFPSVNILYLEDDSKSICNNSKIKIYYYDLYLFKYGVPYYVHNYGFEICGDIEKEQHEDNLKLITNFKIDKSKFAQYLLKSYNGVGITIPENHDENINEFLNNIIDGQYATDFIKKYIAKDNLCYILHYFFMYMRASIGYQFLQLLPCIKKI